MVDSIAKEKSWKLPVIGFTGLNNWDGKHYKQRFLQEKKTSFLGKIEADGLKHMSPGPATYAGDSWKKKSNVCNYGMNHIVKADRITFLDDAAANLSPGAKYNAVDFKKLS